MKTNEPKFIEQGEYTLKIVCWYSEWKKEVFYANTLFKNGRSVLCLPCLKREMTIKDMVAMWKARQMGK